MSRARRLIVRLLVLAAFLVVWEAIFQLKLVSPIIFGSPSLLVGAVFTDGMTFLTAFRVTIFEIAMAILIAWTGGIVFGIVAGSMPLLARVSASILLNLLRAPLQFSWRARPLPSPPWPRS